MVEKMNKLPCLYRFISATKKGDRNTNLFKAINHLRYYNKDSSKEDIIKEALLINNSFDNPLPRHEVTVVCSHVLAKDYFTSCWKFKGYCQHCRYGKFHKTFRQSKPKYWKHINDNNRLVNIKRLPDDVFYPWDIQDLERLHDKEVTCDGEKVILTKNEQKILIQKSRQERGIPIDIDKIVKNYGIPIGKNAENEWEKFKKELNT